jgi:hypothetical protein
MPKLNRNHSLFLADVSDYSMGMASARDRDREGAVSGNMNGVIDFSAALSRVSRISQFKMLL